MSNRHFYSVNGVHSFDNFAEHLAQNDFRPVSLGWIGNIEWFLGCRIARDDGEVLLFFYCLNNDPNVKHRVRGFINVHNNHDSTKSDFKEEKCKDINHIIAWAGPYLPILEVLNLRNGWLDRNGALTLEYGIQVEAISKNQVWMFNFDARLFSLEQKHDMIGFGNTSRRFWCHKKLLLFHNSYFSTIENFNKYVSVPEDFRIVEHLLQIAHGVRESRDSLSDCAKDLINVIKTAAHFKMWNVTRLSEQQLIHLCKPENRLRELGICSAVMVNYAIQHNLRHFLAFLLEFHFCDSDSLKDWKRYYLDFKKAKGGAMKIVVKKILYNDL